VETPSQILSVVNAFLARPTLTPANAFITGYDFLTDEATDISQRLNTYGVVTQTSLISDTWQANDVRPLLFPPAAPGPHLISLNSHFDHFSFYPNNPPDVFATEAVTATTVFTDSLIFTVGCHSGLNVPDSAFVDAGVATDWAQAFLSRNATFLGNTGYGYGDSDLIAYSERLMTNFVGKLGDWSEGPQTVGRALMRAKQLYFNKVAAGSFGNYDEKALEEMTLYGLPMLRVNLPLTTTTPFGGASLANGVTPEAGLPEGAQVSVSTFDASILASPQSYTLTLNYQSNSNTRGAYYTVSGSDDVHVAGGRPIEPRATLNITQTGLYAQGVVWTGGAFTETASFDPIVAQMITDEVYINVEPTYPITRGFYPERIAAVNYFLGIEGVSYERLVVVPGQFRASGVTTPTVGTQRLYTNLSFDVYYAPFDAEDFTAPSVWDVRGTMSGSTLNLSLLATDEDGTVQRVAVLYRPLTSNTWSRAELNYSPSTNAATGSVANLTGATEFIVQAVDNTGNVAYVLDHGQPFQATFPVFLPLVRR
jgi:hypothetical protein